MKSIVLPASPERIPAFVYQSAVSAAACTILPRPTVQPNLSGSVSFTTLPPMGSTLAQRLNFQPNWRFTDSVRPPTVCVERYRTPRLIASTKPGSVFGRRPAGPGFGRNPAS